MHDRIPSVLATLIQDPAGPYWKVVDCPFCGQGHRHSAGEDPREILGEVTAPCGQGRYLLGERRALSATAPEGKPVGGDGNEPNIIIDEPGAP